MERKELDEIIANHLKWIGGKGDKRANLCGADLRGVILRDTNLRKAILRETDLRRADLRRTDLRRADLQGADLRGADLQNANLWGADLQGADLQDANLQDASLWGADLRGADLQDANLQGADLQWAVLRGARLPTGIYQVIGSGSNNRCTTYDSINDRVICGCWDDNKGNNLESFIQRVESVYGPNGTTPHEQYYAEYKAAIRFFETVKNVDNAQDKK